MTDSRRQEMRLFRELAQKVEQRITEAKRQKPTVEVLDAPKVPDPPEIDFDETTTSETLPTDIPTPAELPSASFTPIASLEMSPERTTSLIIGDCFSPKLIRSNSYTLDQPSPMLLKYLDSAGDYPAMAIKKKKLNKSACSTQKTPSPGNRKKTPSGKPSDPAKLRSIYGLKTSPVRRAKAESLDDTKRRLKIHSRGEKVEKFFMKSKTVQEFQNLTQQPKTKLFGDAAIEKQTATLSISYDDNKENEIITVQVVDESSPEDTIIADNRVDQQRVLEQINLQQQNQRLLINKLEELNLMERTSTPVQRMLSAETNDTEEARLNETSFYSTIRGESPPVCSMSLVSDAYSKQYLHSIRSFTNDASSFTTLDHLRQRENEEIAATIINSHVRGYLIRRLLRTEYVQDIIDSIRNILFTILDANPKEIQLKRSFLVQLNGNCGKLHDVFFQFTTKQRMEVIHKDRELLLARLSQRRSKRSLNGTKFASN